MSISQEESPPLLAGEDVKTDADFINKTIEAGANFVAVGIDVTLFAGAMRRLAQGYRQ